MHKTYNKLIRDRIPAIIDAAGKTYAVEVLSDAAYQQALAAKLVEEAKEAQNALADGAQADLHPLPLLTFLKGVKLLPSMDA